MAGPDQRERSAAQTFAALLRRYRLQADLNQEALAERAGLSVYTISNLERGVPHVPRNDTLELLADALGLSPAEQAAFIAAARGHHDTDRPPSTRRGTRLPLPPTPLIGREGELQQATDLLASGGARLLALVGAPGVGKTRLALAVAHALAARADRFPDGVAFVPLAPLADPDLVPDALRQALALREHGDTPALAVVQAGLATRRTLLVLDNVEHLLPAAPLLADLLAACPGLALLVTSRAPLHTRGEQVFEVLPLALPAAPQTSAAGLPRDVAGLPRDVAGLAGLEELEEREELEGLATVASAALFVTRARAVRPDFALTATNASAVATICRRLDGLPLALELAAAQLRLLTPQALLARLDHTLALLCGGPRDLPERQRALWATLAWSHDLLSAPAQHVFRQLAVCAGGCTLETVEAICDGGAAVLDESSEQAGPGIARDVMLQALLQLVDHHLLQRMEPLDAHTDTQRVHGEADVAGEDGTGGEDGAGGEVRLAMLETIRAYAWDRLRASGDEGATRTAHATYFLALAETAAAHLRGPQQALWLARLEREHDNLRAALRWTLDEAARGDAPAMEHGLRFTAALWPFWAARGHLHEGSDWLARALSLADGRVELEHGEQRSPFGSGDARPEAQEMRERERDAQPRQGSGRHPALAPAYAGALRGAAVLALRRGDRGRAAALAEDALVVHRTLGDRGGVAAALGVLGGVALGRGDLAGAEARWEESLALAREVGEPDPIALALMNLGGIAHYRGDDARAAAQQEEALPFFRAAGDLGRLATALNNLAGALYLRGVLGRAGELWEEALALARSAGNVGATALTLANLGSLARQRGESARAETLVRESLALHEQLGDQLHAAESRGLLGALACDRGAWEHADVLLREVLDTYHLLGFTAGIADALAELGRVARGRAAWRDAIALYRDSLATYQEVESQPGLAGALEGLAAGLLHGAQARHAEGAVRACGAATTLRKGGGEPRPPAEHATYEQTLALGREALGEERFAAALAAGEQLTVSQAIAQAWEISAEEVTG